MGLLDSLLYNQNGPSGQGGGLLDRLLPMLGNYQSAGFQQQQPDQAQAMPIGDYQMPRIGNPDQFQPQQAMTPPNAQPTQGQMPMQAPASDPAQPQQLPPAFGGASSLGRLFNPDGLVARLTGNDSRSIAQQNLKAQYDALVPIVGQQKAMLAVMNPHAATAIFEDLKSKDPQNLGQGYVLRHGANKAERLYTPDENTPSSVREYEYYQNHPTPGQPVMDYGTWASKKARDAATNVVQNVDMNSAQTYDKQLAEGLGKSHASLANGVEDAQTRARDIAAMQGAVDAIQKNGGSTGGLAPAQRLELQKSINAGASALGIEKPFNESDLSDKEFLTKFNRSMAGAQAKGAVGARVTNFEMSNFLKANPGLDMTPTGNQRLLGIQAQIEERNIAVGNAIRDATAEAISGGKKINPVEVQKIIKSYDDGHHIKDVVTGQDLTQSYALPEFQNTPSNASMSKAHDENLKSMEKTIGGVTYEQRNGQWYPKK